MERGKYPIIIIPGCAKSGTTFLFESLTESNAIYPSDRSSVKWKELNIFGEQTASIDEFASHYRVNSSGRYLCDATPIYLTSPKYIRSIYNHPELTEVKFIICLRERCEQIFSWYLHNLATHLIRKDSKSPGRLRFASLFDTISTPGLMGLAWKPIAPAIHEILTLFGSNAVVTFNHHKDYDSQSEFWNRASEFLNVRLAPNRDFHWSEFFCPRVRYFNKTRSETINGKEITFDAGDLLFVAGKKSRLWHGISERAAFEVLEAASHFTREVYRQDIVTSCPEIIEDFHSVLNLLQLDMKDFPATDHLVAKEALLDSNALDKLIMPEVASYGQTTRRESAQGASNSHRGRDTPTLELRSLKEERDKAVADRDRARRKLDLVLSSKSWKVTRPFRALAKTVLSLFNGRRSKPSL